LSAAFKERVDCHTTSSELRLLLSMAMSKRFSRQQRSSGRSSRGGGNNNENEHDDNENSQQGGQADDVNPAKDKHRRSARRPFGLFEQKDHSRRRRRRHERLKRNERNVPSSATDDDDQEETLDAGTNPAEFMKEVWNERGYNASKTFSTLRSAYYSDPTPLQRASYHPYFFNLVMNHRKQMEHNNENPDRISTNDDDEEDDEDERMEKIQQILDLGVSPNACNAKGETLLHSLCRVGQQEHAGVVKLLLQAGASAQVSDEMGHTPIHLACSRTKKQRVQRRTKNGKKNKLPPPLPPCFEIVDLVLKRDMYALYMTDAHGHTPLSLVPKDHWPLWMEYLESRKDEFWPVVAQSGGDDEDEDVPPLAKLAPNSQPLPAPTETVSMKIISRLVSGQMQPREAEEKQANNDAASLSSFSMTRDLIRDDDEVSLDDGFIPPQGSDEFIQLGGINVPTLKYAMNKKDYAYNSASDFSSYNNNTSDSDLSFFSQQTEGEVTAEKKRQEELRVTPLRTKSIDTLLVFQDDATSSAASLSGESTAEKQVPTSGLFDERASSNTVRSFSDSILPAPDTFRASTNSIPSTASSLRSSSNSSILLPSTRLRSPSKLSSALHLPGYADDWGNSSFSSRFSDAGEGSSLEFLAEGDPVSSSSGSDEETSKKVQSQEAIQESSNLVSSALDMPGHEMDEAFDSGGDSIPLLLDGEVSVGSSSSGSKGEVDQKVEVALNMQAIMSHVEHDDDDDDDDDNDDASLVLEEKEEEPLDDSSSDCSTQSFMRFI